VTEAEWLNCMDAPLMVDFLCRGRGFTATLKWMVLGWEGRHRRDRPRIRKLRLFTCACCRRIWHLLRDERSREAVAIAEVYADKGVTNKERSAAATPAWAAYEEEADGPLKSAVWAAAACIHGTANPWNVAWSTIWATGIARSLDRPAYKTFASLRAALPPPEVTFLDAEFDALCGLVRDLFGNPFRPFTISPAVLAWNNAVVVRLAQTAYDERHLPVGTLDNGRLAVLADALEEAGCTNADILGHLRGPGRHVRGCWAVDLCLGKS